MNFGEFVLCFFAMAFGVGIIAIISEHRQRMARIREETRARSNQEFAGALESLRQEVASLRDTTTKYDVSFDTALQRLETRVVRLEQRGAATQADPVQAAVRAPGEG